MLELNCTYEESKKILELGYDFKKIATDFVIDFATKFNQTKLKRVNAVMAIDSSIDTFAISGFSQNKPDCFYFIESNKIIPLIPKAALEACLPFKVGIDALYFRKFYKTTYSEEEFEVYQAGVNELESNAVIFSSSSIYEMFLWLHENYPEELKEKFDEVMA